VTRDAITGSKSFIASDFCVVLTVDLIQDPEIIVTLCYRIYNLITDCRSLNSLLGNLYMARHSTLLRSELEIVLRDDPITSLSLPLSGQVSIRGGLDTGVRHSLTTDLI